MSHLPRPVTRVQRAILEEFRRRLRAGEPPPTLRELCDRFGWSSSGSARDHLRSLERKGLLVHIGGKARGYRLADSSIRSVALMGRIIAGRPELAIEENAEQVDVPSNWVSRGDAFALRVYGDSMSGAGILEGDVVVCRVVPAQPGDVVAATIENETTLKRLTKDQRGRYWLSPANPKYERIAVNASETLIHGVVVGLMRDFQPMQVRRSR